MMHRLITASLCLLVVLLSCQKEEFKTDIIYPTLPETSYSYVPKWEGMHAHMEGNDIGITDAGATLGRVLFYDKIVSIDNTVSCGSCHLQHNAFADPVRFSEGISRQITSRNAPAISNLYDDNMLFWDGRSRSIEDLVLEPVRNHKEMGMENMDFLLAKLKKAPYYPALFQAAFGSPDITTDRVTDAMAQFMKSMIGCDSEMDRWSSSQGVLSPVAEQGRAIFFSKGQCFQCHGGPDFNDRGGFFFEPIFPGGQFGWAQDIADIGLDAVPVDRGLGIFDEQLAGVFKIPSLRNVAMTAPYMHDGRFATLEEVVQHYNKGIQRSPNLDVVLQTWGDGETIKLGLTDDEVHSVVAFLHSLTDERYLSDERFADPFVK